MSSEHIVIRQMPDTAISVLVNRAFASAQLEFTDERARRVAVELDIESAIKVLAFMDNGPEAIGRVQRINVPVQLSVSKRPWWRFW